MITVMINAILLEKEYEFRLDPDVPISELTYDIAEMICQKEQYELPNTSDSYILFSKQRYGIFPLHATLRECSVKTGDTLYFG